METQSRAGPDLGTDSADADLLRTAAGGDVEAFRTLFDRYYALVYRFVLRIVRRPELAEEAANDSFLEVWRGAGRFRGESKVSTWIYGIARHKALRALRVMGDSLHVDLEAAEEEADPAQNPHSAAEAWQRRDLVRKALAKLTMEHRAVVELAFYHGLAYSEIAGVLGCPENTVKTRMFHAKRRLAQALAGAQEE